MRTVWRELGEGRRAWRHWGLAYQPGGPAGGFRWIASQRRRTKALWLRGAAALAFSLALGALAPGKLGPSVAHAGEYWVQACDSAPGAAQNAWKPYVDGGSMFAWVTCPSGGDDMGMIMRDRQDAARPARAPLWAKSQFSAAAPPGNELRGAALPRPRLPPAVVGPCYGVFCLGRWHLRRLGR